MRRLLTTAMLAALTVVSFQGVALAQEEYGPTVASVEVNSSSVACDDAITATGRHWPEDAVVELALDDETVASPTTDGDGSYTATFAVPTGVTPGEHLVTANGTGADEALFASTQITIGASASGTPLVGGIVVERPDSSVTVGGISASRNLPTTGSSSTGVYLGVGVGLVLMGSALGVAGLRRRRSHLAA